MTDRSPWPVRLRRLHDPEPDDLRDRTPGERMMMVWAITVTAWAFKGRASGRPQDLADLARLEAGTEGNR